MSDTQNESEVTQASVVEKPNAQSTAEVPKDDSLAKLEATNKRLLEESKANKLRAKEKEDQAKALQEKLEQIENDALVKKENYKELLEKQVAKTKEYENKIKGIKVKALEKTLDFEIAKHASDAHKFDLVKQALPREMLNAIEDGDDFMIEGVKEAIEKVRLDNPFLFKQKTIPSQANGKPGVTTTAGSRSLDKMSPGELATLLAGRKL